MPKRDYYEVLSINRDATNSQIKAAYRRLALRWHPDKNPNHRDIAEVKFKEVSEAFSVLSDKNKRRIYDLYGHAGLESETEPSSEYSRDFDFQTAEDIFRNFFGGRNPFEDLFRDDLFSGFNTDQINDFDSQSIFSDSRIGYVDEDRIFGRQFNNFFTSNQSENRLFESRPYNDRVYNISQAQTNPSSSDSVYVRNEGYRQSVKTTIINRNGKQFKKTETTITYPDGSQEVFENVEDDNASGYLNH